MKVNNFKRIIILLALIFILSCEDMFTRFKYETYECGKNPVKLKKIFIKNYNIGDLVDVEFKDDAYKMEIVENSDQFMILKRIFLWRPPALIYFAGCAKELLLAVTKS